MAAKSTSWCTTETAQGMHVFHVHGYSLLKALGVRRSVRSATFTVAGYDWAVRLFPSGVSSSLNQHAAVSLDLLAVPATAAEARAVYALALVDQSTPGQTRSLLPDGAAKKLQTFRVAMAMPIQTPLIRTSWIDVDRSTLESPPYLVGDRLAIACEVTVIKDPRVSPTLPLPHVAPPPPGLAKDLGELLESSEGVAAGDVTFDVGGGEVQFRAHRAVLAARSPVFRAELLGPMKENASGRVRVEDMQTAVFKALLRFVYTDELPAMAEDLDDDDARTEMHRHLLVAADRYAVARLRNLCEGVLCSSLNMTTVTTTRELAGLHGCARLEKACRQSILASRFPAVEKVLQARRTYTSLFRLAYPLRVMPATTSSCTAETARGAHVFQLRQYSLLRSHQGLAGAMSVRSGSFSVGGCDWAVCLYAPGEVAAGHVSVRVELLRSANSEVMTEVGVRLVDRATGRTRSLLPDAKPKQFHTFSTETLSDNVFTLTVDRKEFEAAPYLQDDRVTIECEITTIDEPRVPANQPLPDFETVAPPGLSAELGELLESGDAADVTFRVGGEVFPAHRAVLAARSPVFKTKLLLGPENENEPEEHVIISIEDMQADVFKAMLVFVYTDALPANAMEELDPDDRTEMHRSLLVAADRYAIEGLRQLCESVLCGGLNTSTVHKTLELAEQHRCDRLQEACNQFIFAYDLKVSNKRRKIS